ncbi:MAG: hypothetical protein M2R45_04736 [Verrucomicrobia subdivision 3 bacterium]|nr:hypothetical protein [Limisphaerales bacterium]MCS1415756.1 hypothetical protein [Limisphaerales bacterium]
MRNLTIFCLAASMLVRVIETSPNTHAATSDYKIQAEDVIKINVFGEPELTMETRVPGSGAITYWLLGSIEVGGKTTKEVEHKIRELLAKDYLVNPQVSINILVYKEKTFSIMGEVKRPGAYPLPAEQPIDITEAIARAGGLTPNARKGRIELYRDGKKSKHDLDDLLKNKSDPKKRILVKLGDVIRVPERWY